MIARQVLEREVRNVIGYLTHVFGKRVGLIVFLTEHGEGNLAYVSTVERDGAIAAIKEWMARVESGLDTDPLGPRAKS